MSDLLKGLNLSKEDSLNALNEIKHIDNIYRIYRTDNPSNDISKSEAIDNVIKKYSIAPQDTIPSDDGSIKTNIKSEEDPMVSDIFKSFDQNRQDIIQSNLLSEYEQDDGEVTSEEYKDLATKLYGDESHPFKLSDQDILNLGLGAPTKTPKDYTGGFLNTVPSLKTQQDYVDDEIARSIPIALDYIAEKEGAGKLLGKYGQMDYISSLFGPGGFLLFGSQEERLLESITDDQWNVIKSEATKRAKELYALDNKEAIESLSNIIKNMDDEFINIIEKRANLNEKIKQRQEVTKTKLEKETIRSSGSEQIISALDSTLENQDNQNSQELSDSINALQSLDEDTQAMLVNESSDTGFFSSIFPQFKKTDQSFSDILFPQSPDSTLPIDTSKVGKMGETIDNDWDLNIQIENTLVNEELDTALQRDMDWGERMTDKEIEDGIKREKIAAIKMRRDQLIDKGVNKVVIDENWRSTYDSTHKFAEPAVPFIVSARDAVINETHRDLVIEDSYRSAHSQDHSHKHKEGVASSDMSYHTIGYAFDLNTEVYKPNTVEYEKISKILRKAGWVNNVEGEWWHWSLEPGSVNQYTGEIL